MVMCSISLLACAACGSEMEESEWGHPTLRQGDCVPLHPLLNGYICAMIV